jgi:hypothetical protein
MDPKVTSDEQEDTSLREDVLNEVAYELAVVEGFHGTFEEWKRARAATTLPAPPENKDDDFPY